MNLLERFKDNITGIDDNRNEYYADLADFQSSPHINKFRPTYDRIFELFKKVEGFCESIVQELNIQEAFNNHGLDDSEEYFSKLLASLEKNPDQWNNSFKNLNQSVNETTIQTLNEIELFKQLINDLILRLNFIKNAHWKLAEDVPNDERQKLILIKKRKIFESLAYGFYDINLKIWKMEDPNLDSHVDVLEWTDLN